MSGVVQRIAGLARRVGQVYHQIFHIYRAWWIYILPFAALVLVPMELLETLFEHEIHSIGTSHFEQLALLTSLAAAVASASLLGQVFLAGAIGLSLLHTRGGKPPPLRWIVRHISYGRLIAVDLLYVGVILLGTAALVLPGLLALLFFALVGPAVEIEDRGVKSAFARSFQLVRRDFWLVLWVLLTIQLVSHYLGVGAEAAVRVLPGDGSVIEVIANSASGVLIEPLFAIAAVLLTMRLAGAEPPPVARPR